LINGSILAAIDSSHPNIWLPIEDCQLFKLAFDLSWNETAQMYFTNETTHSQLLRDNTTIVVTLADSRVANKTIDIHIPYGSFDLTADHPLVPSPRKYFPLKRAANYTQVSLFSCMSISDEGLRAGDVVHNRSCISSGSLYHSRLRAPNLFDRSGKVGRCIPRAKHYCNYASRHFKG
jgi:hypothetical protein